MAFGLGLLATLAAGRYGLDQYMDRREADRNSMLQEGISNALGAAPTVFDADLFPGEAPIEGLYNAGTGLLADPSSVENQLQFSSDIFALPGGQEFASSIFENALGYAQRNVEQDAADNAADERLTRQLGARRQEHIENLDSKNYWAAMGYMQDEAQAAAQLDQPMTGFEFRDVGGERRQVPIMNSKAWREGFAKQQHYEAMITGLDELMDTFSETGTETTPGAARGKLKSLQRIMAVSMKDILDLGVLSEEELRLVQDIIQDPTGIGASGRLNSEIMAGYKVAMDMLQRKLRDHNRLTEGWRGLGSQLDKQTPSQARAASNQARQAQAAAEQGLLDEDPTAGAPANFGSRIPGAGPAAASRNRSPSTLVNPNFRGRGQ